MTNIKKDKKLKQIENYEKSENNESNKHGKIINTNFLILLAITFIAPILLTYINGDYFNTEDYMYKLGIIIYTESFFIYYIKKIAPRINFGYIRAFLILIISYLFQAKDGRDKLEIILILLFSPLLCGISYFGGQLITTIVLTIQRMIKKEKIYDDEMKKVYIGLGIGLLILFGLFTIYF